VPCYLNDCYLKNLAIPKSLKKIIFTQADVPFDYDFKSLKENIKHQDLLFTNVFMPYDNALLYSQLINNYAPAGIKPVLDEDVKNIKFIHNANGLLTHLKKQEFNLHETVLNNANYFKILTDETIL